MFDGGLTLPKRLVETSASRSQLEKTLHVLNDELESLVTIVSGEERATQRHLSLAEAHPPSLLRKSATFVGASRSKMWQRASNGRRPRARIRSGSAAANSDQKSATVLHS